MSGRVDNSSRGQANTPAPKPAAKPAVAAAPRPFAGPAAASAPRAAARPFAGPAEAAGGRRPAPRPFAGPAEAGARERLIEAFTRVAARGGYAQATVADTIAAAGASRSTFYEQFADRDECMRAALARTGERLTGEVDAALAARGGRDPARAAVAALVAFAERDPEAARLLFIESLGAGARALKARDALVDAVAAMVEDGRGASASADGAGAASARPSAGSAGAGGGRGGGEPLLDVPALGLIGGVFRLLSMRLPRGEGALHGLRADLDAWVGSYALADGGPRWHHGCKMGEIELRPAPEPAPARHYPPLPRGRHGLSAAEVARSQRERIVQALARAAYEQGYAAITVSDVVRAAGVARNVFYEQFADKQAAGVAALQQTFEHAMVATASAFFAGAGWPERIWRMGAALTEHYYANPVEAHLSFVELHAIGGEAVPLAHERLAVFQLLLEEGYRHRDGRGGRAPIPRTVSEALVATVLELGYRQAPRPGVKRYPVLLGQQTYMCLAPFVGAGEAGALVEGWLADERG
jgi:AcrR family transcriptional regulator